MATSQKKMLQLLMLSLLLVVCLAQPKKKRVNCTIHPYSPPCRGISAKRGGDSLSVRVSTDTDDARTESLLSPKEAREDNSENN